MRSRLIWVVLSAFCLTMQTVQASTEKDELGTCTYGKYFGYTSYICTTMLACYSNYNYKTGYWSTWSQPCRRLSRGKSGAGM